MLLIPIVTFRWFDLSVHQFWLLEIWFAQIFPRILLDDCAYGERT